MSRILKRPMFRKGGEVTEGIVSMAQPRKNYSLGPGPNAMDDDRLARQAERYANIAQKVIGSDASYDPVAKFLIDFGQSYASARPMGRGVTGAISTAAAAAKEPTKALYAGLDKQEAAKKQLALFGLQQAFGENLALLKGMSDQKKTAAMSNAKEFARVNYKNYPGATEEEQKQNAYRAKFSELLSKERAVTSTVELVRQKENEIIRSEAVRVNPRKAAETAVNINEGKIKVPGGFTGYISVTSKGDSDIIPQGDGTTAIINTKKVNNMNNITYVANQNYIDPLSGAVYQYQGKGTFKRVYP